MQIQEKTKQNKNNIVRVVLLYEPVYFSAKQMAKLDYQLKKIQDRNQDTKFTFAFRKKLIHLLIKKKKKQTTQHSVPFIGNQTTYLDLGM